MVVLDVLQVVGVEVSTMTKGKALMVLLLLSSVLDEKR
jgi:hypothetical protein